MTDIISCCFYVFQAVIQIIMLNRYASEKTKLIPAILFSAVYFAAAASPLPLLLGILITTADLVFYCRIILYGNWRTAILNGVLSAEMIWLSIGVVNSLTVTVTSGSNVMGRAIMGIAVMIIGYILQLALYCVLFSAAQKVIHRESADTHSVFVVLFPLGLVFVIEIYIVKAVYTSAGTDTDGGSDLKIMLLQILGAASVFCVLSAYRRLADSLRMEQRIMIYNGERDHQIQYAREIKEQYQAARSMRHDLKNHILIISELLMKKQYRKASEYIEKLDERIRESESSYNTGSLITDIILNNKLAEISDKDVEISVKVGGIPAEIDETDLCTIFANAVDNAVQALAKCRCDKKIFLITAEKRGSLFFIRFENSFDGKPFKSGTGLENIRSAAERYSGMTQVNASGNVFELKVMMCFSQH